MRICVVGAGTLGKHIDGDRIVGCVVYPAAAVTEAGVIHHVEGDRFPIGELDGSNSDRVQKLHDVLVDAGFRSRILDDIRSEIWLKAWGNLSFNPISALTHATLEDICRFRETRNQARYEIGSRLEPLTVGTSGRRPRVDPEAGFLDCPDALHAQHASPCRENCSAVFGSSEPVNRHEFVI